MLSGHRWRAAELGCLRQLEASWGHTRCASQLACNIRAVRKGLARASVYARALDRTCCAVSSGLRSCDWQRTRSDCDATQAGDASSMLHVSACAATLTMTRTWLGQRTRRARCPRASYAIQVERYLGAPIASSFCHKHVPRVLKNGRRGRTRRMVCLLLLA